MGNTIKFGYLQKFCTQHFWLSQKNHYLCTNKQQLPAVWEHWQRADKGNIGALLLAVHLPHPYTTLCPSFFTAYTMSNGTTTAVQVFQYEQAPVSFRRADGRLMVNATQMANGFGKAPKDWLRTEGSKEFIAMLSADRQICPSQLVQVVKGGNVKQQGTWMHEDVAMEFARWLSPKFAIWCNDRIKELLTTGMTATQPTLEALLQDPALVLGMAQQLLEQRQANAQQQQQIEVLQEQNKVLAAQVAEVQEQKSYIEHVLASKELVTTTQIAADYGFSAVTFNKKLAELRVQYKVNGQWILYTCHACKGYTQSVTHEYQRGDGSYGTAMHTYWRQSGRLFLYELLKKHGILPLIER